MEEKVPNIITIRKQDITLATQAFSELMRKTEILINDDAKKNPSDYRGFSVPQLEQQSVLIIQQACENTPFNAKEVKLVSGQRFPDIIAEKYYGVEVKSTKSDHWTSTGSSIVESTRDDNVEDIYMLFGKMGGLVPEFKCRPYEDVLYDIAVTHSPRYLINMEIGKDDTIFTKMGISYNDFRTSDDSIDRVRHYYREKARARNKQEMPWWITSENIESTKSFNIKLWNTLSQDEKKSLKVKSMILFPDALDPNGPSNKYNQISLWLCSYNQVVMPNIRDLFTAGGKITHVNGKRLRNPIQRVYKQIVDFADDIKRELDNPTDDLLMLIKDYNPTLVQGNNMFELWVNICCGFLGENENKIDLKEWIRNKPVFHCHTDN